MLMAAPFLVPVNVCYTIDAKMQVMGIAQRMGPFMQWLRAFTVIQPSIINAFIIVDLLDLTLEHI